jgi:hypothetical protein
MSINKTLKLLRTFLLTASIVGLSGCASKRNATILPGANLGAVKNYYVVRLSTDDRKINRLIAEDLVRRGFHATTGEPYAVPADSEALVTYRDKWMWDMSMYLLQLDVQIRKPKTDIPMATGMAMHTSLVRRSPTEMVKEAMDEIFKKAREPAAKGTE